MFYYSMKTRKPRKQRNLQAVDAHFRKKAGPHKNREDKRSDTKFLKYLKEELELTEELKKDS